jgi:hypothetical protein
VLKHRAGAQIAQLGLNKCAQVAGCAVRHAENRMQVVVVFDNHARTQLGRRNSHS